MEVKRSKTFLDNPQYSIEWGYATWSQYNIHKDWAIRNRYNKTNGGFNIRGSNEIPWADFNIMIDESIKGNQFTNKELRRIFMAT